MAGVPAAVDVAVEGRRDRSGLLGWAVLALLVVLLAFELTALLSSDRTLPRASSADVDVARRFAVAVTSFDYRRLDADIGRVLDLSTPAFGPDLRSALRGTFLEQAAANKSISTSGVVAGPRVQTISGGRATFLVVVDQTVTSETSSAQPRLVHTGLIVTVQEKDHKVASVRVL